MGSIRGPTFPSRDRDGTQEESQRAKIGNVRREEKHLKKITENQAARSGGHIFQMLPEGIGKAGVIFQSGQNGKPGAEGKTF